MTTSDSSPPAALPTLPFKVAAISGRNATHVKFRPSGPERAAIAQSLGLLDLPKLEFDGEIRPLGKRDLILTGQITAHAIQPCVVSLDPVPAQIDEKVTRKYLSDWEEPSGEEAEIPDDETAEALPEVIDAAAVVIEALALALPLYPRAAGVELGEAVFAEPGAKPLRQDDLKPFAGLAQLMGQDKTPKG